MIAANSFTVMHDLEYTQFGTPGGIRTPDLLVRSQTLYPAELRAHILHEPFYHIKKEMSSIKFKKLFLEL